MPSTGGTSFLHLWALKKMVSLCVCQCPLRAGPHFYGKQTPKIAKSCQCVNALYGRDLISTQVSGNRNAQKGLCQCPLRAGPHFYTEKDAIQKNVKERMCQCPLRAGPHFYANIITVFDATIFTCQCPLRAGPHFYVEIDLYVGTGICVSMPSTGGTSFLQQ